MIQNQIVNYALVSPQNPRYLYFLKNPQLTANTNNFIDQTNAYFSLEDLPKLSPFVYYQIKYTLIRKKQNTVKIIQAFPLAKIGQEWNSQHFLKHMQNFQGTLKQPEANNPFMREEMEHGQLRVNDEGWIYVKSFKSGFRKKLKIVNNSFAIPLLKGCKVHFFLRKYAQNEGPKVKISGLEFKKLNLAGILKIINGRIFFQPRHTDYERMIPLSIPQELMQILYEQLPNYRGSLPYNIFKRYNGGDTVSINHKFSQYVLKGRFVDWPLKFSHPIIQIQSISQMNCENLKQATLYELGIPFIEYDAQQKRLSDQIIQNFNPQLLTDRLKVQERCYSFDCQGGSCFDDAFSFVRINNGYKVSIHISDVPELIGNNQYLLKQAKQRDQTIYIKNYYRSMFPQKLRDIMSLQQGKFRLTFSLTFQIKDDGTILYDKVQFNKSIIKVDQNITHGEILNKKQDQVILSGLAKALHNCKQLQNLLLFDDVETAKITSQLLYLSSYLPLVTFYTNQSKLSLVINETDRYFSQIIQKAHKMIKEYALMNKDIPKIQVISHHQSNQQLKNEQVIVPNQQQISFLKLQQKPQFDSKYVGNGQLTHYSESSVDELQDLNQNQHDYSPQNEKKGSVSPYMRAINIQKNEFLRKVTPKQGSAAECFRFLDKLFRAAQMNVDFTNPKNIQNAFKYCEKKNDDPIAKTYFRTKLIMSKQHFEVIGKLAREGKLKQFQIGNSTFQYPNTPQKVSQQQKEQNNSEIIKINPLQIQPEKKQMLNTQKKQIQPNLKLTQKNIQKTVEQTEQTQKVQNKQQQKIQTLSKQHEISFIYNILTWILKYPLDMEKAQQKESLNTLLNQLIELSKSLKLQIQAKSDNQILQEIDNEICKRIQYQQPTQQSSIPFLLKWNTPIRSGTSFQALQLLKRYQWIFKGHLRPSTAILHRKQSQMIQSLIKNILQKRSRQESFELSGRMKQACRELAKIDFLFVVRQQPDKIWEFVTITSPSQKVQFVYREFIEEVQVQNPQKNVVYYTRVKGRFKGIFQFPIKLKVVLEEQ